MTEFVDQQAVDSFEHAIDDGGLVWAKYDITSQPAFAFINDDGTVDAKVGSLGSDGLTEKLEALIAS